MDEKKNYTYILECSDHTLYTGWTTDIIRREKEHNAGKGARYTRVRLPVHLVYYEEYASKKEAMQREYAIKQLSREEKLALIAGKTQNVAERDNKGIKP